jgi:hypothetical protein
MEYNNENPDKLLTEVTDSVKQDHADKGTVLSYLRQRRGQIAALLMAAGIMVGGCDYELSCNCNGCEISSAKVDDGEASCTACGGCDN